MAVRYQTTLWYVAQCQTCEPRLVMPFDEEDKRDQWAVVHHDGTGHYVRIGTHERTRLAR